MPVDPRESRAQVCQRCLMRLEAGAGGVELPRRLRATLAVHGLGERVKVSLTGCLGYCPTGRVSVQLFLAGGKTAVVLLEPARDGEDLLVHLPREPADGP